MNKEKFPKISLWMVDPEEKKKAEYTKALIEDNRGLAKENEELKKCLNEMTENWKKVTENYLDLKEEKEMKPVDLPFEKALKLIKDGFRLTRKGWNGSNQYVFLMDGYPEGVPANQALSKRSGIKEGRTVIVDPYIMMKNAQGHIVPWMASQGDLLANDWEIITIGKIIGVDFVGTAAVVVEANIEDDIVYIKKVKWMEVE